MTIKGIDISSIQGTGFSTSGLSFCFVKATEGHTYINPEQTAQAARARAAGCVVGFYHFLWPGNAKTQAAYFVKKCASVPGDILACDWEPTSSGTASNADKDAFIKEVKRLRPDHKVVLYCDVSRWTGVDRTSYCGDGLWIADPNHPAGHPGVQHAWTFHQYGIRGTDLDVGNFASKAALAKWAGAPAPKPPAKPKIDLSQLIKAARTDPGAAQGHHTYAAGVRLVEAALKAEGLLASRYAGDGSFGTTTVTAYAAWQRHLGYHGSDADGIPGKASLVKLGQAHGFTVVA